MVTRTLRDTPIIAKRTNATEPRDGSADHKLFNMPPPHRHLQLSLVLLALVPNPSTPFVMLQTLRPPTKQLSRDRLAATSISAGEHRIDPPEQPYLSLSSIFKGVQHSAGKAATSLFHLDVTDEELDSSLLCVKGLTTPVLVRAPSIGSFSLVKSFTNESLQSFIGTVNKVVSSDPNNRILTGRAVSLFCGLEGSQVRVIPGEFDPDKGYSFVDVVDARERLPSPSKVNKNNYLDYIDNYIQDLISKPCAPTLRQIENKEPLFRVSVVLLPDEYACVFIGMSHVLGDIVTYTALMDQLSSLHDAHKSRPIKWNNPEQSTHSISSESLSQADKQIMYGLPFVVGVTKNLWTIPHRKHEYLSLSREKINAKRKEFCAEGGTPLSSNDIVMAALCDANRSSEIFAYTTRSTKELHSKECQGGNLYVEVPFPRDFGSDPNRFRALFKKGHYYEKDGLPIKPFLAGRMGRITSCVAPLSVHMQFGEGSETICQAPPHEFVHMTPFDSAVIFTQDSDHIGILHNFAEIDKSSELLQGILA